MANVVVFLAEGFEEIEGLATVDILRRAGHIVHTVGIDGQVITGSHKISVKTDDELETFYWAQIDALVLPGGIPGAHHLRENDFLIQKLKEYSKKGKIIAAICAAPIVLHRAGLLKKKKFTCYPGFEEEINDGIYTGTIVEKDGKIITGCGAAASFEFAYTIAEALGTDTSSLREGMQYNKLFKK